MSKNTFISYPIELIKKDGTNCFAYRLPYNNLYETLSTTAEKFPEKVGVIDANRSITFAALKEETDALASYLVHDLGLGKGSKIALMIVNSIEFCTVFYATLKIGATIASVSTKSSGDEILYIVNNSEADTIFMDSAWYPRLSALKDTCCLKNYILCGTSEPEYGISYTQALAIGRTLPETSVISDSSLPAVIMHTSGTTGNPKGAVLTHFNMLQAMYSYIDAEQMDENESTVLAVPAFHITGMNCVITPFITLGGLMIMVPFFDPVIVLDKMTEYQITHFHAVATVYIMLESAMLDRHDLSGLRSALCGGGAITHETIERFCRKAPNCQFRPVYGMTETSGAGTYFPVHCLDSEIKNSCGKVVPVCQIKIVDENEQTVPVGTDGEICFKGAFIISSYLHNQGAQSFVDGWLHSGDVGHFDNNGYLFIKDRIKDMINRGGEKIFSLSVEKEIMRFGNIKQAAVFAVKDPLYGEVPGAVIIPEPGHTVDLAELTSFLRGCLSHYKVPKYMEIRDHMPTTANGKVQKFVLKQEFDSRYASKS